MVARSGFGVFRVSRAQLLTAALVGVLLPAGGNGLVVVAEQGVASGLAALLVAAVPLWIALLRATRGDRPSKLVALGVVVGFLGVAVLLLPSRSHGGNQAWYAALVVLASLSWSIGSFISTRRPMPADPFAATATDVRHTTSERRISSDAILVLMPNLSATAQ